MCSWEDEGSRSCPPHFIELSLSSIVTSHVTRTCCSAWVCPGSHQGTAMGRGDPVSSHQRELILPFGGREAVCISSTPTPKKLPLFCCLWLLARAPVPSSFEWHSLAVSAGHTGLQLWACSVGCAHPFQTSWESTGAPGDPKPSGQHMLTGRICTRHCSGAGGGFDLLFRVRISLSSMKFLYPATLHEVVLQTKS